MSRSRGWRRRMRSVRDGLSFSSSVRNLVDILNQDLGSPDRLKLRYPSHPGGFIRAVASRRINMAEAYLKLTSSPAPDDMATRLSALRHIVHSAWHAKTLSMPLNTARVQIQLVKECVRARGNRTRQLELMQDFSEASHGQEAVIRRLLRELGLMEAPEDGRSLRELNLGWDDHVHDSSSMGRKTPSQLLLDAFIKGMSRITVAYYDLNDRRVYEEVYEAARILGIDVQVGVEFSVGPANERRQYMFIPPQDGTADGLERFLQENQEVLAFFHQGLAENAEIRAQGLRDLLERFNQVHLHTLNHRYEGIPVLQIPPVTWDDVKRTISGARISRAQMGFVLAEFMRPVLHRRVLYLRNQLTHVSFRRREGGVSDWEVDHIKREYEAALRDYHECTPHLLQERFAGRGAVIDRPSAFSNLDDVGPTLRRLGGRIVFIHPLSVGLSRALQALVYGHPWITGVETFNMSDALLRDPAELRRLNRFVALLNSGSEQDILKKLGEWGIAPPVREGLPAALEHYKKHPLVVCFGSDYIGGHPGVPGMGFIASPGLSPRTLGALRRHGHSTVPHSIAMVQMSQHWDPQGLGGGSQVFFVSRIQAVEYNVLGEDEDRSDSATPRRFWRNLNPNLRFTVKALIAFVPALLTVGPWYTLLWLGITGFRNVLADLVSSSGISVKTWSLGNVDRDNVGNSVFWTGFSVPLLASAKHGFDLAWPLISGPSGFIEALAKFWVIAFVNGLYISSHNKVRGFPTSVIRGNFFRTVLSWPLATAGSFVLGPLGVPAIVQSKLWSDFVAGLIEGTSKFMRRIRLRQRDLMELLISLKNSTSQVTNFILVDILYIWARRDRGKAALKAMLQGRAGAWDKKDQVMSLSRDKEFISWARARLVQDFNAEGNLEHLTCAVLSHFEGVEAEVLCRVIGNEHRPFALWLKKLQGPS